MNSSNQIRNSKKNQSSRKGESKNESSKHEKLRIQKRINNIYLYGIWNPGRRNKHFCFFRRSTSICTMQEKHSADMHQRGIRLGNMRTRTSAGTVTTTARSDPGEPNKRKEKEL